MLDQFLVFKKSGLVLFKYELTALKGSDPVDELIRTVLLENRSTTESAFSSGSYAVKWKLVNKEEIVCVAVYQRMLAPPYVDDLLDSVAASFAKLFKDEIDDASGPLDFGKKFDKLLGEAESSSRRPRGERKPAASPASPEQDDEGAPRGGKSGSNPAADEDAADDDFGQFRRGTRAKRVPRPYQGRKGSPKSSSKTKRAWNEKEDLTEEEAKALEVGKGASTAELEESELRKAQIYLPDEKGEKADIDKEDDDTDDDDDDDGGWSFGASKVGNFFANLTGQKPLTREELAPVVEKMEKQLMSKNVSMVAAREICESVAQDLEGQKLGSMTRGMSTAVRESCEKALARLLTPKRSIDILREAKAVKASENRPYTVVFIGVNGVGKSTSLSKVAYYLKNNGLSVMLCACDTFRSGAIEQIKVHGRNLELPVFASGYDKDAAAVATNGIKHATESGHDVVLIDTAGRMQNNEPLMRSLTKLVANNRPDLVLFVGEALAGNDSTDQLVMFNRALKDYSQSPDPRTIDGTILTKFDTISDKVGAAVSMVHSSGQPILFIGTGQKYTNLNRINVRKILKALLAD